MKSITGALEQDFGSEVSTLAYCWKVTLRDGTVLGFTSASRDVVFGGVRYEAGSGMKATEVASHSDGSVDELEADSVLDSVRVSETDLITGRWDYATVRLFRVNYLDPTRGALKIRTGTLGKISAKGPRFSAELRGLLQALQQSFGRVYSAGCPWTLGDTNCGVALGPIATGGTVTSVTSRRVFTDSGRVEADGWFTDGRIDWNTGANAGRRMEVRRYQSGGVVTLFEAMPEAIQVGDTYTLIPGCNKTHKVADDGTVTGDCKNKFNNVVNFGGQPFAPGVDAMLKPGGA